jgi:hypothetical protein
MFSLTRTLFAAMAAATIAAGQPALTLIQDTLYRADGTRFNGTMFITWNSFQAGDTSNIATSNLTLQIVNGVLKVSLVPTTNATPGAQYMVKYNSKGINQFTEIWAVPPSALPLRVRDVRVSQGTVVGPPAVTTPIQIGDVTGLLNELAIRPMKGVGFAVGRAAVINQAGQIDGAAGNLASCVRVDGSSGTCGSGSGGTFVFSDAEIPTGVIDGVNTVFNLIFTPAPSSSLELFRNGLRLQAGADYTLNGKAINFFVASLPQPGDLLSASYRYADPSNPGTTFAPPQVVCSSVGTTTSSTSPTLLGSCTVPSGSLNIGDRIEVAFAYSHSGTAIGFSSQLVVGSTTIVSRDTGSSETLLAGKASFGLVPSGQLYDTRTFGAASGELISVGTAAESIANDLTLSFKGHMASAGGDTMKLESFTVVRYPAQSNP